MNAIGPAAATGAPLLRASHLTKRYGGLVAVNDLSFHVNPGEILGLIGENGAGKSTTFNLISGHTPSTSGRLVFRGEDITGQSMATICRRGLTRTFQHQSYLKSMSVRDNILLGTLRSLPDDDARTNRIDQIAKLLGLAPWLDEAAGSLPHGVQRMLSIAIALATGPVLLCLDEPLTGLNVTEVRAALQAIREIRDALGTTIILVDHNMRAVMQVCDRIVVLSYGQHLAEGTPGEVRVNPAVIKAYLGEDE